MKVEKEAEVEIVEDALAEDQEITVETGIVDPDHSFNKTPEGVEDYIGRRQAGRRQKLTSIGNGVRFGPSGLSFKKPVVIVLYYDENELPDGADKNDLKIYYWNAERKTWEEVPGSMSIVDDDKVVIEIDHFSIYQIMLVPAEEPEDNEPETINEYFRKGEVYSFPNPAKNGVNPTFHFSIGKADTVTLTIYDAAGIKVHAADVSGLLKQENGVYLYEYIWNVSGVASGVYICSVHAVKEGYADICEVKKLAVIK